MIQNDVWLYCEPKFDDAQSICWGDCDTQWRAVMTRFGAISAPEQMPRMESMKLIDYDFQKYGSGVERKRIIARWEKEVGSLPK